MMFPRGNGKSHLALERMMERIERQEKCRWCKDARGKTDLSFSIIDDDFGQYVHYGLVKFCPFCGRELNA